MVLAGESLRHAALGAVVAGGGMTAMQALLARKLQAPNSLALALGGFHPADADSEPDDNNSARAAAVAAVVALALLSDKRKDMIVAYAAIEAMIALSREKQLMPHVKYIEILLGVPVYAQMIHSWVMKSELFDKAQCATLDRLSTLDPAVLRRMREQIPTNKVLSRCDVFHPGEACSRFHSDFFATSIGYSARLYVPIYLFSAVLPKYKQWLWGPRPELSRLAVQYIRTCLCLTLAYQIPLASSCVIGVTTSHRLAVILSGMVAAFGLLAEHERRRASVLKAVTVYSLCSFGAHVSATLGVSRSAVKSFQFALFSAALAMIFRHPERQSRMLMKYLYGYDGGAKQSPAAPATEVPSTASKAVV
ncbi:hypothetical protein PybrP1_012788 [[Pythium] brassicae (nom. inval.)]|nr:hypothetical protein PybrP1_012788 [[Pythium] brassicae (nom. inval.)]